MSFQQDCLLPNAAVTPTESLQEALRIVEISCGSQTQRAPTDPAQLQGVLAYQSTVGNTTSPPTNLPTNRPTNQCFLVANPNGHFWKRELLEQDW